MHRSSTKGNYKRSMTDSMEPRNGHSSTSDCWRFKIERCLRCLFGYPYRARWSVWADWQKDELWLRVYVMQFTGDKISHMTKIWHSGMALKDRGWAWTDVAVWSPQDHERVGTPGPRLGRARAGAPSHEQSSPDAR